MADKENSCNSRVIHVDITGQRFSMLVAVNTTGVRRGQRYWNCRCDCGIYTEVSTKVLRVGGKKSCGCLMNSSNRSKRKRTHGLARTLEYRSWAGMRARCLSEKSAGYENYGGRGIGIYDRWIDSFPNFLADMGHRPSPNHSLERIDNDKGYSPDNCRWATKKDQNRNRRDSVFVTIDGVTLVASEWIERSGIHTDTVRARVRRGKSWKEALEL